MRVARHSRYSPTQALMKVVRACEHVSMCEEGGG